MDVGDLDDLATGVVDGQPFAEGLPPLRLAEEGPVAQAGEHRAGRPAEPGEEEGGGRPRRRVVEPGVGDPAGAPDVGDEGDRGDPPVGARRTAAATTGSSGALRTRPWLTRPAAPRPSTTRARARGPGPLCPWGTGPAASPAGSCPATPRWPPGDGVPEPVRGVQDDVDEEGATREPDLARLPVELEHGGLDGPHGPRADPRPVVEHPVDGRRETFLLGEVLDAMSWDDPRSQLPFMRSF